MQLLFKENNKYSIAELNGANIKEVHGKRFKHYKEEEMFEELVIVTDKGTFSIYGCSHCHGVDIYDSLNGKGR